MAKTTPCQSHSKKWSKLILQLHKFIFFLDAPCVEVAVTLKVVAWACAAVKPVLRGRLEAVAWTCVTVGSVSVAQGWLCTWFAVIVQVTLEGLLLGFVTGSSNIAASMLSSSSSSSNLNSGSSLVSIFFKKKHHKYFETNNIKKTKLDI